MEDTLRGNMLYSCATSLGLNPCFNGRYSQREKKSIIEQLVKVLILVLMEDTLRVTDCLCRGLTPTVLILVLMEDTLRGIYNL